MAKVVKIRPKDIPGLELAKGMMTQYNVCQETVGSEFIKMGVCNHSPDMADLKWVATAEEAFYVARGSIKLAWETESGDNGEVVVREGEQVFLPRGFRYALKSTGEPAINVFAIGGAPSAIGTAFGLEAAAKLKAAGEEIQPR
jgi:mannose-6-phosphate isomerase-like protein (cupin superfamily)